MCFCLFFFVFLIGRRKHQTGDAGDSSTRRLRGRISVSVINSRADNYSYLIDREPRAGITFARQRSLPTEAICTYVNTTMFSHYLPKQHDMCSLFGNIYL